MNIASTIISVYSESLGVRDYLRNQIHACGFNAICFETETTFIDNLSTIKPKMAIVQTELADCVWRFLFSIHFSGLRSPILLLSERLRADRFLQIGHGISIRSIAGHHKSGRLRGMINELAADMTAGKTGNTTPLYVGESEETRKVRSLLPKIAHSGDSVIITGEKGTGKELLARIIVEASDAKKRIVKIDCAELKPRVLVNGAMRKIVRLYNKSGLITVLFDKIHRMPLNLQSDLLLFVEEAQKFEAAANSGAQHHVRFIATSEYKIDTLVHRGTFRKDLYYRLNVIPFFLPSLRNRRADIPLLMDYFVVESCIKNNKSIVIPSKKAREMLIMYSWPGNADELQNCMYRFAIEGNESSIFNNQKIQKYVKSSGDYSLKAASMEELPKIIEIKDFIPTAKSLSLKSICDEFVSRTERRLMKRALESTNWNRKKAAELLNISYKSMLNKIKAYDIL